MADTKPIAAYVVYGADGIITGAALADRGDADAQGWLRPGPGRAVERVITASPIRLGMRRSEIVEVPWDPQEDDRIYACVECGKLRSKAEGGTVFTVCEACWDKRYKGRRDYGEDPSPEQFRAFRTERRSHAVHSQLGGDHQSGSLSVPAGASI